MGGQTLASACDQERFRKPLCIDVVPAEQVDELMRDDAQSLQPPGLRGVRPDLPPDNFDAEGGFRISRGD